MRHTVTLLALLLLACSGSSSERRGPDASPPEDDLRDGGPNGPAPAAAPDLGTCPEGWRTLDGAPGCDPWPEGGPHRCTGDDEAHFPGEPACRRVGSACPADGWPADLPEADVRFVRPGAAGSGSREAPYGTLAEALVDARPGTTVALAEGTYEAGVGIPDGVTLVGACVAGTRLEPATPIAGPSAALRVEGTGVRIGNLFVSGVRGGILLDPGSEATLESLVVDGVATVGIAAAGARVDLREVVVRRTRAPAEGKAGMGLWLTSDATATVERAVFEENRRAGVLVEASRARLTDVAVIDTQAHDAGGSRSGIGVAALAAPELLLRRVAVERSRAAGVVLFDETEAALDRVIIRETEPADGSTEGAISLAVAFDAQAEASRLAVVDGRHLGVSLYRGGRLRASDVWLRGGRADGSGPARALALQSGAEVDLSRALIEETEGIAVLAFDAGSRATLTDVRIRGARPLESDADGWGTSLHAQEGASIEGTRVEVEGSRGSGLTAILEGARIRLEDATIADTATRTCAADCGGLGIGDSVQAIFGGHVELERFVVRGGGRAGVLVAEGGTMDLHDGVVRDHPLGASVQTMGFDAARLMDGVTFRDNDRNLERRSLPLPEPASPL